MAATAVQEREAPTSPAPAEQFRRGQGVAPYFFWAVATLAAGVALGQLLYDYAQQTWSSEHYRFGPLLVLAAAYLAFRRFRETSRGQGRIVARLAFWSVALLGTAGAVFAASPFAAVVALMAILLAAAYEGGGWPLLRRMLPVWALVWLAVRPPFNWDQTFVLGLQKTATVWASAVLDLGGIRHLADGVAIRLPGQNFFVDEACSGIHSLFAALAFAGVFSVAMQRGLIRTGIMLTTAVLWVLVANAARICAVVVLSTRYGLPVTEGLGHELLGVATFAVVIALIMSTDRFLLFLVPEKSTDPLAMPPEEAWRQFAEQGQVAVVNMPHRGLVVPGLVAIVFIGLAAVVVAAPPRTLKTSPVLASDEGFKKVEADDLPAAWNGWTRTNFRIQHREAGDLAGELSRIWTFQKGRIVAAVSIDGPYSEWHDLAVCYEGLGYAVDSARDMAAAGTPVRYTELRMTNETGHHGLSLFAAYTESNRPVDPPRSEAGPLIDRIKLAFKRRFEPKQETTGLQERVYQVQLLSQSGLGFTPTEHRELVALFQEMRQRIAGSGTTAVSETAATTAVGPGGDR